MYDQHSAHCDQVLSHLTSKNYILFTFKPILCTYTAQQRGQRGSSQPSHPCWNPHHSTCACRPSHGDSGCLNVLSQKPSASWWMTHNPRDGLHRTSVRPSTPKNSAINVLIKNIGMKNDYFLTMLTIPKTAMSFRSLSVKSLAAMKSAISLLTGVKRHVCWELVSGSHRIECQVKFCKIQALPNQCRTQHITPKHKAQGSWVKASSFSKPTTH